jgi:hypothetical protein
MRRHLCLILLLSLVPLPLSAETPEEKGLAIAHEIDRRDLGFGNWVAEATMHLRDPHGGESVRHFRLSTMEVTGDGDKTLTVFEQPPDVAGTAILTFSHGLEPDDQWMYFPALKRVKRIAAKNKSGPFVGSEFAYEDLGSREVKKYTYRYLRDEVLDGHECYVVENTPAYEYSGYTRLEEWVDKTLHQPRKIVYYDRKNTILKTLTFKDYRQYLGQYWRADEMRMENHQTGKSTQLVWKEYRFRVGLSEQDFTQNALARAR